MKLNFSLARLFRILLPLSIFFLAASSILFIPAVRDLIIDFGEHYAGKSLTRHVWHERIFNLELQIFIFTSFFIGFFYTFLKIKFSDSELPFFEKVKTKNIEKLILVIVFAVLSLFRFYWMNQKTGFHEDEFYSIGITNRNQGVFGYWNNYNLEKNKPYKGIEITENAYFDSASLTDTVSDLAHHWINTKDSPHPSLYYIFLRIWFTFVKTSDFKTIFIRGSLLNYLFFIASFFFFIKLLRLHTDSIFAITLLPLIAFLNPASLSLSIFIRPYALQETAFIAIAYLFTRYMQLFRNGISDFSRKFYLKSVLLMAFFLSAGYFCTFFLFFLGLILLVYCIFTKQQKQTFIYVISLLCGAVVVSKLFYLSYGSGFFEGRGTEAISKLSDSILNLKIGTKTAIVLIERNLFSFSKILAILTMNTGLYFFIRRFRKNEKNSASLTGIFLASAMILTFFIIMFFAPVKLLRYIASGFAVLSLVFLPCTRNKRFALVFTVLQVLAVFTNVKRTFPSEKNVSNIEHINDTDPKSSNPEYNKHPKIQVFVKNGFYATFIMPYLNPDQTYYFMDEKTNPDDYNFEEYYLIDYQFGKGFSETLIKK